MLRKTNLFIADLSNPYSPSSREFRIFEVALYSLTINTPLLIVKTSKENYGFNHVNSLRLIYFCIFFFFFFYPCKYLFPKNTYLFDCKRYLRAFIDTNKISPIHTIILTCPDINFLRYFLNASEVISKLKGTLN